MLAVAGESFRDTLTSFFPHPPYHPLQYCHIILYATKPYTDTIIIYNVTIGPVGTQLRDHITQGIDKSMEFVTELRKVSRNFF